MVDVVTTDEFSAWFDSLEDLHVDPVIEAVGLLSREGLALGFPRSSKIAGAGFALRELRV